MDDDAEKVAAKPVATDKIPAISAMIKAAQQHADNASRGRLRADRYYKGDAVELSKSEDLPFDENRSRIVSGDVRATIKKVLPSLVRTFLGSDSVAEYLPVAEGDEEFADQATDYIGNVVLPEADGPRAIEDALHDALRLKNGILHWYVDMRREVAFSTHTGLPDDSFAELVGDDDVEVLEHSETEEDVESQDPMGQRFLQETKFHSVKIKRTEERKKFCIVAVPRDEFLIHPDAATLEDSPIVGRKMELSRSDLVAMGYDKDKVYGFPRAGETLSDADVRRDAPTTGNDESQSNEVVDYYEVFVRIDTDGDGIAELHHMRFAGGTGEENLLMDEMADAVQFCDVRVMAQPHQWEGMSLADDVIPMMRAKTVLLRQTMDNLYAQNNPRRVAKRGSVDEESLNDNRFGATIWVNQGANADALGYTSVPMVAEKSYAMMAYLDTAIEDVTGVSDASAGLAPDALQNMTAKASAMIEAAGIGQSELMARTAAEGLRKLFRGLLRLIIQHQDVPRTVRLRGKWVSFDPRQWNAEMDCRVNTGLGAGTRERDMQMMQMVMAMQEKLLVAFGAQDNPFVTPENGFAALAKMVEAAGLRTTSLYFTKPDPEQFKAHMAQKANQPNPDMMKAQAQMQMEQARLQLDRQKLEADIQMRREQMQAEFALKREQMQAEMDLKRQQMAAQAMLGNGIGNGGNMSPIRMGGAIG